MLYVWVRSFNQSILINDMVMIWFSRKRLDKYEVIRQTLRNLSLVNDTDNTRGCGRKQTKGWRCNVCTTTHFCTIQVGVTPVAKKAGRISFLSLLSGSRHWKDQTNDEDALQEGAPIGRNFAGTFFPVLQLIFFEKNNLLGIIDSTLLLSSSALSYFSFQGYGFKLFSCYEANTCKDWSNGKDWISYEPLENFM